MRFDENNRMSFWGLSAGIFDFQPHGHITTTAMKICPQVYSRSQAELLAF